jgi:hypothetical protein
MGFHLSLNRVSAFTVPMAGIGMMLSADAALAQSPSAAAIYESSHTIETGVKGVTTFPAPLAGFNPLSASAEQRAAYGLPPQPDPVADAAHYRKWARAMAAPAKRATTPLKITNLQNGAMKATGQHPAGPVGATTSVGSYNWSGVVNTISNLSNWSSTQSIYYVVSEFNVPVAQQAFGGVCDGGWDLEASWNGIDGFSNGDVLQGGTLSGAYCSGGTTATDYFAWVEWYPSYNIIGVFSVNPGDEMFVETWDTSSTNGYVYIADLTQGTHGTYHLKPTMPPYLVGNSAEYIVERPCCITGTNLYPLANYVQDSWTDDSADTFGGAHLYPGSTSVSTYKVTMYNDNGTQAISWPSEIVGNSQIILEDENCAYSGGCKP